jgi:hypothetical protein
MTIFRFFLLIFSLIYAIYAQPQKNSFQLSLSSGFSYTSSNSIVSTFEYYEGLPKYYPARIN